MSRRKSIRFGDYIQAMSIDSQKIPYQELMPEPLFDRHGNEHPQPVPKMKLGGGDIIKILQPIMLCKPSLPEPLTPLVSIPFSKNKLS